MTRNIHWLFSAIALGLCMLDLVAMTMIVLLEGR